MTQSEVLAGFGDTHPRFGKPSDFLSLPVTDKVMVENNVGLQVDDLLPDGLEQQVGAGICLIGAVEARDLVVSRLEGTLRVSIRDEGSRSRSQSRELLYKKTGNRKIECGQSDAVQMSFMFLMHQPSPLTSFQCYLLFL